MNLYHVTYVTSRNSTGEMFVLASSQGNAWAQCQISDPTAMTPTSIGTMATGIIVGS
jgi:hypothetical protein